MNAAFRFAFQMVSDRKRIRFSKWAPLLLTLTLLVSGSKGFAEKGGRMIRISEIEIDPAHLAQYKEILKEEAGASVRLEAGVIAIFPMYQRENPTQVQILEIYASNEAYESHLKTPHFQRYKTATLKMVKSLKLVDMESLDPETMNLIFRKLKDPQ